MRNEPQQLNLFSTHAPPDRIEHGSQTFRVLELLESRPIITNYDLKLIGLAYIGRNRISDLRKKYGYVIAQRGAW